MGNMRDNQRLAKIRQLPCCNCGASPPSQACHSNFGEHGKGKGIKADDRYTIPLCHSCHKRFDEYSDFNREQSKAKFEKWLIKTNRALNYDDEPAF